MFKKLRTFLFSNVSQRQTAAKNAFWLFSGEAISRLLRAGIVIYAARLLGKEGLGVFSYVITAAAFLTIFSDIGLSAILTRETSKHPENKNKYLATAFSVKICLSVLMAAVAIFGAPYLAKDSAIQALLPLAGLILIFDGFRDFGFAVNRAAEKMEKEAFAKALTNVAIIVFAIAFLWISPTPTALLWGYVAGSGAGLIYTIFVLKNEFRASLGRPEKSLIRPLILSAWPFALAGFLGSIMINTDIVIIGWFRSVAEVGVYSTAQKIIQVLYFIPSIVSSALFPAMARSAEDNKEALKRIVQKSLGALFCLSIPAALLGAVFSRDIIGFLFGAEYLGAGLSLRILLLTLPFAFSGPVFLNALFARNEQKKFTTFLALGAAVNVILDIALVGRYGIAGCALSTLLATILSNGFLGWSLRKKLEFSFSGLSKIFAATGLAIFFSILLKIFGLNFILAGISGLIIYVMALRFSKSEILNDIMSVLK